MPVLYKQIAAFFKSLADESRLRIILTLAEESKSVSQVVEETGFSQPLVSHHLKELKNNLIVRTERKSSFVFYELSEPALIELIKITNHLLIELNEQNNSIISNQSKPELPFPVMMKKMFEFMNGENKKGEIK